MVYINYIIIIEFSSFRQTQKTFIYLYTYTDAYNIIYIDSDLIYVLRLKLNFHKLPKIHTRMQLVVFVYQKVLKLN